MLKAAQVGLGWWGSQVTKVLQGSEKIQVVCGVDPAEQTGAKYTADHGLPVYTDYQQALKDPGVEAVILTVPHRLHEEARRAGGRGRQAGLLREAPVAERAERPADDRGV